MILIYDWAVIWGVPIYAINDLLQRLGMGFNSHHVGASNGVSESAIQNKLRLSASKKGVLLFRNNVGALIDETGRLVRYGLANDSKQLNSNIKSGDLIGIKPTLITPAMVGYTLGQFVSRECKPSDWRYTGTPREVAQARWIEIVLSKGGDAAFANGANELW